MSFIGIFFPSGAWKFLDASCKTRMLYSVLESASLATQVHCAWNGNPTVWSICTSGGLSTKHCKHLLCTHARESMLPPSMAMHAGSVFQDRQDSELLGSGFISRSLQYISVQYMTKSNDMVHSQWIDFSWHMSLVSQPYLVTNRKFWLSVLFVLIHFKAETLAGKKRLELWWNPASCLGVCNCLLVIVAMNSWYENAFCFDRARLLCSFSEMWMNFIACYLFGNLFTWDAIFFGLCNACK